MFIANGYSDKFILSKLKENDINLTEKFARNIVLNLIYKYEYIKYYGIFKDNVNKFQILAGH